MEKLILIGCGQIAEAAHLPTLQQLHEEGALELAGVCDLDANRARAMAAQFGVPRHGSDWWQLARECGARAVGICLPPGPNAEVAAAAMEAGLHVLCEKPPGRDAAQAQKLAQAAADHPELIGMIAFNRRYAPFYRDAWERSQKLGAPHTFYGRFVRAASGQAPSNTVNDWLSSDGSHVLDLAVATMGFPHRADVTRCNVGDGPDNVWTIHLHTPHGGAAIIFDFSAGQRVERFEWSGPGYDALLELPGRTVWAQGGGKPEEWKYETPTLAAAAAGYGFKGEYEVLIQAMRGEIPRPQADVSYAPAFMQLVQALLACPSHHSCEIATAPPSSRRQPQWAEPQKHNGIPAMYSAQTASPLQSNGAGRRPVVQITQPPSEQPKYFPTQLITDLSRRCELHLTNSDEEFQERLERMEVLITGWRSRYLTREEMERATALKLAIVLGVSVKGIFPDLLLERGVLMCSTAEIVARSVAEHCLLLTLAGLRELCDIDHRMRAGAWPPQPAPESASHDFKTRARHLARNGANGLRREFHHVPGATMLKPALVPVVEKVRARLASHEAGPSTGPPQRHDLRGQTVGLIGWGNIARHYAKLLQPFGCRLLVYSQHADAKELETLNGRHAALGEVLASCRVVSLHQGLTARTRGALGAAELALLRPGTLLVNTARAELLDENALLDRLRRGDILAAFDVFHQEPLPVDHPLRSMNNVVLSPHNANHTPECFARAGEQALHWISDWLEGRSVPALDAARIANMT